MLILMDTQIVCGTSATLQYLLVQQVRPFSVEGRLVRFSKHAARDIHSTGVLQEGAGRDVVSVTRFGANLRSGAGKRVCGCSAVRSSVDTG